MIQKNSIFFFVAVMIVCNITYGTNGLQVLKVDSSTVSSVAFKGLNGPVLKMSKQTGNLDGDGKQQVVLYESGQLQSYTIINGVLQKKHSCESELPLMLLTGGDSHKEFRLQRYHDSNYLNIHNRKDDIVFYTEQSVYGNFVNLRAYSAVDDSLEISGTLSMLTEFPVAIGYTDKYNITDPNNLFDRINMYRTSKDIVRFNGAYGSFGCEYFTNTARVWENPNLIDFQRINVAKYNNFDNFMACIFYDYMLVVTNQNASGVAYNLTTPVNVGGNDEALFLQAGDVKVYVSDSPEELVLYRKDGTVTVYDSVLPDHVLIETGSGNIGTGVMTMLLGDVTGNASEELVVLKGQNLVEVWDLTNTIPVQVSAFTIDGAVDEISLGDLDDDGKQNIIVAGNLNLCKADFDGSGLVNFEDFAVFANEWLLQSSIADFDNSGVVDLKDLEMFVQSWLE